MKNKMSPINSRLKYPPMLAGLVTICGKNIKPVIAAKMHTKTSNIVRLHRHNRRWSRRKLCAKLAGCQIKSGLADDIPIFDGFAVWPPIIIVIGDQDAALPRNAPRTLNVKCPVSDNLCAGTTVGNFMHFTKVQPQQICGAPDAAKGQAKQRCKCLIDGGHVHGKYGQFVAKIERILNRQQRGKTSRCGAVPPVTGSPRSLILIKFLDASKGFWNFSSVPTAF